MADHRKKSRKLRTVRAVVDALGGTNTAAARLELGPSAVANWLAKDCIPPVWFLRLSTELKELGCEADASLFRQFTRSETNAA